MANLRHSFFLSLSSIFIIFKGDVFALDCHVCAGADSAPSFDAVNLLETLNISSIPVRGDCKDKNAPNICTNGLFCSKRAVIYSIEQSVLKLQWTTFEKGCFVESSETTKPSKGCVDGETTTHDGYKKTIRQCYCDSNFCNADTIITTSTSIAMTLLVFVMSS